MGETGEIGQFDELEMLSDRVEELVRRLATEKSGCNIKGISRYARYPLDGERTLDVFIDRSRLLGESRGDYIAVLDVLDANGEPLEDITVSGQSRDLFCTVEGDCEVGDDMTPLELKAYVNDFLERHGIVELAELVDQRRFAD